MKKIVFLLVICLAFITRANAGVIFESATGPFDSTFCCGSFTNSTQFIGTSFVLNEKTNIDQIGGHFLNFSGHSGSIFGALVNLNDSGFPSSSALTLGSVIAFNVFVPNTGSDFLAPISATLEAGKYGVVFGSGLFGATGNQALTLLQPFQATTSSGNIFYSSSSTNWFASSDNPNRYRIIVDGVAAVPEPSGFVLLIAGVCFLGLFARRRKKIHDH